MLHFLYFLKKSHNKNTAENFEKYFKLCCICKKNYFFDFSNRLVEKILDNSNSDFFIVFFFQQLMTVYVLLHVFIFSGPGRHEKSDIVRKSIIKINNYRKNLESF